VGIARATFDGLTAAVMELSLACHLQGDGLVYQNGSLIEKDASGVGRTLGQAFVDELLNLGATFIFVPIEPCEADFYRSIGFKENTGKMSFFIDRRPYVQPGDSRRGPIPPFPIELRRTSSSGLEAQRNSYAR